MSSLAYTSDPLLAPRLAPADSARLRDALELGPWRWPEPEDLRFSRALGLCPSGPRPPHPGETLLLAVSDTAASIWLLRLGDSSPSAVGFGAHAEKAFEGAADALPRSLPVLWSSVREARSARPRAAFVGALPRSGHFATLERVLDGPSFGLSFLLGLASRVLGRPLPDDLAASAALDERGRALPVDGLAEKLEALGRLAPRVRRVLVAAGQAPEARLALEGLRLEVVGVQSGAEALGHAWGDLGGLLAAAGADDHKQREIADGLFRLVLRGRSEVLDWSPVERAALVALESWTGLDEHHRWRLAFAAAVAGRHERNRGEMPLPDRTRLAALPKPVQLEVMAHYVQQSADTGWPDARTVLELAWSVLGVPDEGALRAELPNMFAQHLRLAGAIGRLLARVDDPRRALDVQKAVARGLLERLLPKETSFQLSECFRLAGALQDQHAFVEAEALYQEVDRQGGLGLDGSPYVDLARCRGLVGLGKAQEALRTLQRLAGDGRLPDHVRWSSLRWLARAMDELGQTAEADEILRTGWPGTGAQTQEGDAQPDEAQLYRALVALDRALRLGDQPGAAAALGDTRRLAPGPLAHLLASAAAQGAPAAAHVARFYPY